jgi:hypothetical protein
MGRYVFIVYLFVTFFNLKINFVQLPNFFCLI